MKSGQLAIATAGTALRLGTEVIRGGLIVKALDTNTGVMAIGNDGNDDVTVSNGFRLLKGEYVQFKYVHSLGEIMVDASVNGEKVCWITVD